MPPTTIWPESQSAEPEFSPSSLPPTGGNLEEALGGSEGVGVEAGLAFAALGLVVFGAVCGLVVWAGRKWPDTIARCLDRLCCLSCGVQASHVLDFANVLERLQRRREVVEVHFAGLQPPPPSPAPSLRSMCLPASPQRQQEAIYIDPAENPEIQRALSLISSVLPTGSPPPLPPPPRRLPELVYQPPTPTPEEVERIYSRAATRVPSSLRGKGGEKKSTKA